MPSIRVIAQPTFYCSCTRHSLSIRNKYYIMPVASSLPPHHIKVQILMHVSIINVHLIQHSIKLNFVVHFFLKRNSLEGKKRLTKIPFSLFFHVTFWYCCAAVATGYRYPFTQRERKQRKLYAEEYALGDDDHEGVRGFSVAEKLESDRFAQTGMVREMIGADLTVG